PRHVHEDRDDEARLQEHEEQDQTPAQRPVAEEVRRIRESAEDEEQRPDPEVDAERVLLAVARRALHLNLRIFYGRHAFSSPQIEEREDEDPDEIDEVPVKAGDLDDLVVASGALVVASEHL